MDKFSLVPDDGEKLGGTFKKKSSPYPLRNSAESKNKKNVISLYIWAPALYIKNQEKVKALLNGVDVGNDA